MKHLWFFFQKRKLWSRIVPAHHSGQTQWGGVIHKWLSCEIGQDQVKQLWFSNMVMFFTDPLWTRQTKDRTPWAVNHKWLGREIGEDAMKQLWFINQHTTNLGWIRPKSNRLWAIKGSAMKQFWFTNQHTILTWGWIRNGQWTINGLAAKNEAFRTSNKSKRCTWQTGHIWKLHWHIQTHPHTQETRNHTMYTKWWGTTSSYNYYI